MYRFRGHPVHTAGISGVRYEIYNYGPRWSALFLPDWHTALARKMPRRSPRRPDSQLPHGLTTTASPIPLHSPSVLPVPIWLVCLPHLYCPNLCTYVPFNLPAYKTCIHLFHVYVFHLSSLCIWYVMCCLQVPWCIGATALPQFTIQLTMVNVVVICG